MGSLIALYSNQVCCLQRPGGCLIGQSNLQKHIDSQKKSRTIKKTTSQPLTDCWDSYYYRWIPRRTITRRPAPADIRAVKACEREWFAIHGHLGVCTRALTASMDFSRNTEESPEAQPAEVKGGPPARPIWARGSPTGWAPSLTRLTSLCFSPLVVVPQGTCPAGCGARCCGTARASCPWATPAMSTGSMGCPSCTASPSRTVGFQFGWVRWWTSSYTV